MPLCGGRPGTPRRPGQAGGRGAGGGLHVTAPDLSTVTETAALYLDYLQVRAGELYSAREVLESRCIELAVERLDPIRKGMTELQSDPSYIDGMLCAGAARARSEARQTMDAVKDIVGFIR